MTNITGRLGTFSCHPLFHLILIVVAGFLAYSNSLHVPLLFDDWYFITANPAIKNFNYFIHPSLLHDVDSTLFKSLVSRYVGYLSFSANYWLHGFTVTGFHIVNLCIHIGNALLAYGLVRVSLKSTAHTAQALAQRPPATVFIPLGLGLMFVSHPIQTESVTYIYQRLTSLAALFFLLALLLYIHARRAQERDGAPGFSFLPLYLTSLTLALLSMKTKENCFTLPIIMALYEVMFLSGAWKRRVSCLLPFFLTMLIIPLSSLYLNGSIGEALRMETDMSRLDYFFTQLRVIVTYLRLLLVPVGLNIDHDVEVSHSFSEGGVAASGILLIFLFIASLYFSFIRKSGDGTIPYRLMGFGILWFFITISIESSFIPIRDLMFEHRTYLPAFGALLALTAGIELVRLRLGSTGYLHYVLLSLVVMGAVMATFSRNMVWQDGISFWEDAARKSPLKGRPHANLGQQYLDAGRMNEAQISLKTAIQLEPDYKEAIYNLGIVYGKMGRYADSMVMFNRAMALTSEEKRLIPPDKASIQFQLGVVCQLSGLSRRAMGYYSSSLRLNPDNPRVYYNMGLLRWREADPAGAEACFQAALRLKPDYTAALENLAAVRRRRE